MNKEQIEVEEDRITQLAKALLDLTTVVTEQGVMLKMMLEQNASQSLVNQALMEQLNKKADLPSNSR
jgi:hypothetical protein